jgi:hypothetical protein
VECLSDANCSASSGRGTCDNLGTQRCIRCTDAYCAAQRHPYSYCLAVAGGCVECLVDANCAGANEICQLPGPRTPGNVCVSRPDGG